MIAFKNLRALDDWKDIHPKLREVLEYLLSIWPVFHEMTITRIAEPDANQKTEIHTCGPPHRAADIRTRSVPFQTVERAAESVNSQFVYDGDRPKQVAIIHDAGSGDHLHIQVSNNTARKPAV